MRISNLLPLAFVGGVFALPVITLPWFGQIPLDSIVGPCMSYLHGFQEERTIYQVLKDDKHYSRLVKAIDLSDDVVDLLNDSSKSITFFAVPNSKLPHHHRSPRDDDGDGEDSISSLAANPDDVTHDFGDIIRRAEDLDKEPDSHEKERRKEFLARIIRGILAYHILPEKYEVSDLVQNSTYATNLTLDDGSMNFKPLRLSVLSTTVPPRLKINMFVEVTKSDIQAKNGVVHQINRPLFPPPSIFQEAFFVPQVFAYFTSAIQRVGLTGAIDRWYYSGDDEHKGGFLGATETTAFAPTSDAFMRLPKKLRYYLFSPFGYDALRKLLEYHIVPNNVLHTDYFHNSSSGFNFMDTTECFDDVLGAHAYVPLSTFPYDDMENGIFYGKYAPLPELVYEYNATLPTLLEDHHLRIHVARYKSKLPLPGLSKFSTTFRVNGHDVGPFDIPARNGALHVMPIILDPREGRDNREHEDDGKYDETAWEDWEDWLPQWAMEN